MYFVYILECEDGTLYTGIARDIEKRFEEHKEGKGARYTRAHKPVKVVYSEECSDRSIASKREMEIKALSRKQKEALLRKNNTKV